ncbi:hypothetical protein D9M73_294780 [compost metagenome]
MQGHGRNHYIDATVGDTGQARHVFFAQFDVVDALLADRFTAHLEHAGGQVGTDELGPRVQPGQLQQ